MKFSFLCFIMSVGSPAIRGIEVRALRAGAKICSWVHHLRGSIWHCLYQVRGILASRDLEDDQFIPKENMQDLPCPSSGFTVTHQAASCWASPFQPWEKTVPAFAFTLFFFVCGFLCSCPYFSCLKRLGGNVGDGSCISQGKSLT